MFHPIDVHVGNRVRQRRTLLGISQSTLGKAVGLTFQQVQKYERGGNRLAASRLYEFATILDVPVEYFFEGLSAGDRSSPTRNKGREIDYVGPVGWTKDVLSKRETLYLVRAYFKIRDPSLRSAIASMIKSLAKQ